MKGFSIKKLAAVAVGAALVGSALAPVVSAADVTRSDIYADDGTPAVGVVVGSMAAVSDGVWAGNIAAKIAEKAAVTNQVNVSGAGATGSCSVSDLTVDLAIGGTVSYGEGARTVRYPLDSGATVEIDNEEFNHARLSSLYTGTIRQRLNDVTTDTTVLEKINLNVDAKMETSIADYRDLLAVIYSGGFEYEVSFTPGIDLGTTNYVSSDANFHRVILFGKEFQISSADTTSERITLVDSSGRRRYNEGDVMTGLEGRNDYEGETLEIVFESVVQTGGATPYEAIFSLYDSDGTLLDSVQAGPNANLANRFRYDGEYVLKSNVFLDNVAMATTTQVGFVNVTRGTDTVILRNGRGYPYDETDTSGLYPWSVEVLFSGNVLTGIKIKNAEAMWLDNPGEHAFEPLYPMRAGQSLLGREGEPAVLLQGLPEDTLGYGYASLAFEGFETEEMTTIKFMKGLTGLPTNAHGGVHFMADKASIHNIPYFFTHTLSSATATFNFDNQNTHADITYDPQATPFTVSIPHGGTFNGYELDLGGTGCDDSSIGGQDVNLSGSTFDFNGMTYTGVSCTTAGDLNFSTVAKVLYRTHGTKEAPLGIIGTYYLANDTNVLEATVPFKGNHEEEFHYALKLDNSRRQVFALLAKQEFPTVYNGHKIIFNGTDTIENGSIDKDFYYPDTSSFHDDYDPDDYHVAKFTVTEASALGSPQDFVIHVDTQDGGNIGPFPNSDLNHYSVDATFGGTPSLQLRSGTHENYYQKAYTDKGHKFMLLGSNYGDGVQLDLTRLRRDVEFVLSGSEVTREIVGGETLTLALDETATTSGGVTVGLTNMAYDVDCEDGEAGECVATPSEYKAPASVRNPIVYLDSEAPTGRVVIVGGPAVNTLAQGIAGVADELVAAGNRIMRVSPEGHVLVMGYTAQDTVAAARELIDLIDSFN